MNKKISVGITISLVVIAAAITFILTSTISLQIFNNNIKDVKERAEKYASFEEFDNTVRTYYNGTIDETKLLDSIFDGYLSGLDDKYAHYYSAEDYQSQQLSDSGVLLGIGVSVTEDESGYIKVSEITKDSPSEKTGILAGDIIVAVNNNDVLKTGYNESINAIKSGEEGTSVKLTVRRDGENKSFDIKRQTLEIVSVTGKMLDNNIGYIHISGFNQKTYEQFSKVLKEMTDGGAKGLIFDVRNNPGGLVTSVEEVLDDLLPEGEIAFATYNNGKKITIVKSDAEKIDLPMVVLINANSASGAELFSASLRDFAKAQLIGVKSYGKGVMQNTYTLSDGGAVKITVATYQTTKSDCFDGIGLTPDFEVQLPESDNVDIFELDPLKDTQLNKAIEVIETLKK